MVPLHGNIGLPDYSAPNFTDHYGAVSVGYPKEAEKKACRLLGKKWMIIREIERKSANSIYRFPGGGSAINPYVGCILLFIFFIS